MPAVRYHVCISGMPGPPGSLSGCRAARTPWPSKLGPISCVSLCTASPTGVCLLCTGIRQLTSTMEEPACSIGFARIMPGPTWLSCGSSNGCPRSSPWCVQTRAHRQSRGPAGTVPSTTAWKWCLGHKASCRTTSRIVPSHPTVWTCYCSFAIQLLPILRHVSCQHLHRVHLPLHPLLLIRGPLIAAATVSPRHPRHSPRQQVMSAHPAN